MSATGALILSRDIFLPSKCCEREGTKAPLSHRRLTEEPLFSPFAATPVYHGLAQPGVISSRTARAARGSGTMSLRDPRRGGRRRHCLRAEPGRGTGEATVGAAGGGHPSHRGAPRARPRRTRCEGSAQTRAALPRGHGRWREVFTLQLIPWRPPSGVRFELSHPGQFLRSLLRAGGYVEKPCGFR